MLKFVHIEIVNHIMRAMTEVKGAEANCTSSSASGYKESIEPCRDCLLKSEILLEQALKKLVDACPIEDKDGIHCICNPFSLPCPIHGKQRR
jgi:hypothetical protein